MNVDGIEVSPFCSEHALFEYVIKREYVFTEKCLILACHIREYIFFKSSRDILQKIGRWSPIALELIRYVSDTRLHTTY